MSTSTSSPDNDHHPYISSRKTSRADVAPLHEALHSPSPLGNILDNIHRSHTSASGSDASRYNLSPNPRMPYDDGEGTINSTTTFGAGSIASSAVATLVGGVRHSISHWRVLLFGQLISFFLAAAGAASEELNGTCHVSVPLTQTALVGAVLMLLGAVKMNGWCAGCCFLKRRRGFKINDGDRNEEEEDFCSKGEDGELQTSIRTPLNEEEDDLAFRDDKNDGWGFDHDDEHTTTSMAKSKKASRPRSFCFGLQTIHAPWWAYFLSGLVAVEARYLIFLSFRYTSFTFIYMVDALAIPSAMVFSKYLLGRSYRFTHLLGGFVCISGIVVSTVSDLKGNDDAKQIGSRSDVNSLEHMKGDILAITGAVLLGLDDVISEMLIKDYGGVDEVLFGKWVFGLGISVVQLIFLEMEDFTELFKDQGNEPCDVSMRFILLSTYLVFQVLDMAGEVRFLRISEAALLNLSLLTSDLWATVFSIFAVGIAPPGSYYAAFVLIVLGIVLYEAGPSPISHVTPSGIKITMRHMETDATQHTANIMKNGKIDGDVEMT
mmetsp:Transcript_27100/g.57197  ORF Transcript_27100/g.57197 Transcript_27100/m.57197 type:complete len:547 (+) Transcript_27100:129-1769(+)